MKLKVITSILLGIFIVLLSTVAFAGTGTVELKSNVTEVKKGETFKVTLSARSEEGINGIDAKYNYDAEKLELVSEKVIDASKWSNIGSSNNITIISNSSFNCWCSSYTFNTIFSKQRKYSYYSY